MESVTGYLGDTKRLRCRLCFHAGENKQLVEVFTKNQDISKRVISALGVKINRSEKQARICTVCETLVDIIQSFQAVCKQTNQLHHDRRDFLLYDSFWNAQEQDAVKITEKMILTHRSEVDKTISGTIVVPTLKKGEFERPALQPQVEEQRTNNKLPEEEVKEQHAGNVAFERPKTEMVLCEPLIKDEPRDENEPRIEFHPELEESPASDVEPLEEDNKPDSDSRSRDAESASSMIHDTAKRKKNRRRKFSRKLSESSPGDENDRLTDESDETGQKRTKRRPSKRRTNNDDPPNPSDDDEREPKIPGKRGPRRKKVRKSDPSVCDICGETVAHFVKESHRNQHLGVRPYKCSYEGCGRSYFSQNDLRTHAKRHQITYHVCEICGRNIKGVEWFRRHVKTHTEGPQFTCEVCGSKFRRKAQLQTHMVTHTGITPHECEICGKRFALKYNLDAHVKRHQKREENDKDSEKQNVPEKRTWKYYVKADNAGKKHHVTCETCGKSVHKREIEGHVNKHLGRRPYSCDQAGCTLAFYGLRGIKEHKMVVHSDKILRYECSICNRSIKGAGTFKRHVMMHNSDMKVECQHCGKKFTSKSYLKAHEQKHSGERPYVCEMCGRSFAMKPCWKMHMKTVHNEDRREPTRVRRRETEEVKQQQTVSIDGELLQTLPSAVDVPLNSQNDSQQQYQPAMLVTATHAAETQNFTSPNPVRTDYSY
ncbi:zinc finger protein 14-like [Sabethes cyaneus]|uniref:zinc finger protein 14-like n=1 Tax=Sabethes cyaneus TaxID=53552 RepID=UPI00237ECCC7|nr:zinc finger protein 14-like [Sabethes cyaneus]